VKDSWGDLKITLSSIYKEFGVSDSFSKDEPNLKNAYLCTEALWKKQYKSIDRIYFVLIGEAPLFGDRQSYFYNEEFKLTPFFRHQIQPEVKSVSSAEKSDLLRKLRENGFIILDLFPYALNDKTAISYQKKFRSKKIYIKLFERTYDLYLKPKIELIKIKSAKNIKFSFRYKKHKVLTDKMKFRLGENGFSESSIQVGCVGSSNMSIDTKKLAEEYEQSKSVI